MIGEPSEILDKLGQFLMVQWRDDVLRHHRMLMELKMRGPARQRLQMRISQLSPEVRGLIDEIVTDVVNTATHDLLRALQEAHDLKLGIELTVDGKVPAEISGMLHGEIQGPDGWIERYSAFKSQPL